MTVAKLDIELIIRYVFYFRDTCT